MQQPSHQALTHHLHSALGLLNLDPNSQLYRDTTALCRYLEKPCYRIAVFGPFNYGKSTLLNALLGNRTLPIDIIPTTGAAIHVNYGEELHTQITLTDGSQINQPGIEILKQFAILNDQRQMRKDVAAVQVFCPHPFLKTGVELLDLPGSNDREEQNQFISEQLLTADLIVQVLDGRQLMTLGERENLRDWLLDRGINTVVFVVNFLNLLEPDDQKAIYNRMRFVAENFRADLPHNMSNLYRVDALPALRGRLKGDTNMAQTSGLTMFESALQGIVAAHLEKTTVQGPRIQSVVNQIKEVLQAKVQEISTALATAKQKHQAKLEIKQKAEKLIKKGFQGSCSDLQSWLYLPKLLSRYQMELAKALEIGNFQGWHGEIFQAEISQQVQGIQDWVKKACEFFEGEYPGDFILPFPEPPQVILPPPPQGSTAASNAVPVTLATGVGFVLGGPVGAAVLGGASYMLSKVAGKEKPLSVAAYQQQVNQAYEVAATAYLTRFSEDSFKALSEYERRAERVINCQVPAENLLENSSQQYQLQLLNTVLENLQQIARL